MAAISVVGFERGTHLGLITGNSGISPSRYMDRTAGTLGTVVSLVAGAARTGGYGLLINSSAAVGFCGWANNSNGGILGTSAIGVVSFWFNLDTLPAADATIFQTFGTAGGGDMSLDWDQSTGFLVAIAGSNFQNGPALSADTWYHVDVKVDYSVNPHRIQWTVDGVAQTDVTAAVAAEQVFIMGFGSDNVAQTLNCRFDDVLLSITAGDYPFGKHKVIQLIPDTADTAVEIGTANSTRRFTGNATADGSFNSADILAATSEVPPLISGAATGVCQVTSGTGNAVGIPMTTYTLAAGETVSGVRLAAIGWALTTTAALIGFRTFNGTSETIVYALADPNFDNSTTAPASLCKMATLADFDTQAELDAMVIRLGYSNDVSPIIGAHAVYVEIAVKESTAAPSVNPWGSWVVNQSVSRAAVT